MEIIIGIVVVLGIIAVFYNRKSKAESSAETVSTPAVPENAVVEATPVVETPAPVVEAAPKATPAKKVAKPKAPAKPKATPAKTAKPKAAAKTAKPKAE